MTSNVIGDYDTAGVQYRWMIPYFCCDCKKKDEVRSPVMPVKSYYDTYEWQFMLYPKGKGINHNTDTLSVYLLNCGGRSCTASISISILNHENEEVVKQVFGMKSYYAGQYCSSELVKYDFIKDKANHILDNNHRCLNISCEIILYEIKMKKTEEVQLDLLRLQQFNEFEKLIDDKEFSDVSLLVEGKTLRAHKNILAKRSSVFAAMFQTEMKEKLENAVEIKDIKYEVFVELLRYVYAGMVDGIDTMAGELLAAADLYALDGLKVLCENSMCKNLNVDEIFENLKLADRYNMQILKVKAIEFIVSNAKTIVGTPEFRQLPNDIVCDVCLALANKYN